MASLAFAPPKTVRSRLGRRHIPTCVPTQISSPAWRPSHVPVTHSIPSLFATNCHVNEDPAIPSGFPMGVSLLHLHLLSSALNAKFSYALSRLEFASASVFWSLVIVNLLFNRYAGLAVVDQLYASRTTGRTS